MRTCLPCAGEGYTVEQKKDPKRTSVSQMGSGNSRGRARKGWLAFVKRVFGM